MTAPCPWRWATSRKCTFGSACWTRQEIVDFTTRHLKAAAAEARGMAWSAADPPAYLWCPAASLPDWVVYRPDRDASIYACTLLKRLFDPAYLRGRR